MNLFRLTVFKLIKEGVLSEEEGRILATLHQHKNLNLVELAEHSGLEIKDVVSGTKKLSEKNVISLHGVYYSLPYPLETLYQLIESHEAKQTNKAFASELAYA